MHLLLHRWKVRREGRVHHRTIAFDYYDVINATNIIFPVPPKILILKN